MKTSIVSLALISIMMLGLNSCSQRYGYISKVKGPKKDKEEQIVKRSAKPASTAELRVKADAPVIENTAAKVEVSNQPSPLSATAIPKEEYKANTRSAQDVFRKAGAFAAKYHNPYKKLAGKGVSIFPKKENSAIASADNMQFGKDKQTVILAGIIGLVGIILAAILDAGILYTIGSIFLLIALVILILILVE